MSCARTAHLHGQEILLIRQDAVGVDVFLEPVAAGRESVASPHLPAQPLPAPKGMPSTHPVRPLLHQHPQ